MIKVDVKLVCDDCACSLIQHYDYKEKEKYTLFDILVEVESKEGWTITKDKDLCPECKKKYYPRTIEAAINKLIETLDKKERDIIKNTAKGELIMFHHGFGTAIRNTFGLWNNNPALLKDCKCEHPDDASMVIIKALWKKLNEK